MARSLDISLTPREQERVTTAISLGVNARYATRIFLGAREASVPFAVACAVVMKETSGGLNIYGHDVREVKLFSGEPLYIPQPFTAPSGVNIDVTRDNYVHGYAPERDRFRKPDNSGVRCNGVGLYQLTHWSLQDKADELGGCWDPMWQTVVAMEYLAGLKATSASWLEAFHRYNGTNKPQSVYAIPVNGLLAKFREAFVNIKA